MLIDCDSCTARPRACGDCIVTHLLQVGPVRASTEDSWSDPSTVSTAPTASARWDVDARDVHARDVDAPDVDARDVAGPPGSPELTESEVAAVAVLAAGGLVPPLRLVTPDRPTAPGTTAPGTTAPGTTAPGTTRRHAGRGARRTRTG